MLVQPVESTLGKGQCDQHGLRRDTPVVAESLRRDYENRQLDPNDPVFRSNLPSDRQVFNSCDNPKNLTEFQNGPALTPHLLEVRMRGWSKVDKSSWDSFHVSRALNGRSTVVVGEAI
jgi:hypothetical protein